MNNHQYQTAPSNSLNYGTPQSQSTASTDGIMALGAGVTGFFMLVSIIICVLWVWSLTSIISLHARFKEFLEEYRENELYKNPQQADESTGVEDSASGSQDPQNPTPSE